MFRNLNTFGFLTLSVSAPSRCDTAWTGTYIIIIAKRTMARVNWRCLHPGCTCAFHFQRKGILHAKKISLPSVVRVVSALLTS
jgi:hypothetical protein